jgi:PAS domain S-box-containing protein
MINRRRAELARFSRVALRSGQKAGIPMDLPLFGRFEQLEKNDNKAQRANYGAVMDAITQAGPSPTPLRFPAASDIEDFFENGTVALHLVGREGTILHANKAELDLLGYSAEEYIGRHIAEFHADANAIDDILARLSRGEKLDKYPAQLRTKSGVIKHVVISSSVQFKDGEFLNTRCFTVDVTELKLAQDKVNESERQLRQVLDSLPAAVYTTDAQGVITYYNPAAVQMAGRVPEVGKDEWCVTWKLFTPDGKHLPHGECPMAVALKENRPIRGVEAVAERPDGIRTPFVPFPTPIRDSSGNLVGAVNMLVDLTERKQSESRQIMLLNELNHRIKNNLQMLYSLLRTAGRETDSDEAKRVLSDASQRVSAIAAAQRVLYNPDSPSTFQADEFLSAVCVSAQQSFEKNVKIEITPVRGKLQNDISLPLALILNELLTNAVKHGLRSKPGTIKVSLNETRDDLQLNVADGGSGFQVNDGQARLSSGLGLIRALVRQIGGTFSVACESGTKCCVTFPKSRALSH